MKAAKKAGVLQALLLWATLLSSAAALFFAVFYFVFYWPYRHLFNEDGRYFDEQNLVVYHAQDGLLVVPALIFLFLALTFGVIWWIRRRQLMS